jgi:hypothetical protein
MNSTRIQYYSFFHILIAIVIGLGLFGAAMYGLYLVDLLSSLLMVAAISWQDPQLDNIPSLEYLI